MNQTQEKTCSTCYYRNGCEYDEIREYGDDCGGDAWIPGVQAEEATDETTTT